MTYGKIIVSGCAVLVTVAAACGSKPEEKPVSQAAPSAAADQPRQPANMVKISDEMLRDLRITISKVERHKGGEAASLLGELGVNENTYAEVGTSLQARVVSLAAVTGQTVRAGDTLATLESGELAKARGELATAEARLALTERALERKRGLNAERIVPTREVQEAENEQLAAEAQVRAARATLQALGAPEQALEGRSAATFVLRSPVSGTVIERSVAVGQIADPSRSLFRIADLSIIWLTVHAFERDALRLQPGAPARITFAGIPGRTFTGSVSLIGRTVDVESRTVAIRIDMANRDGLLRPGMSATALLPVGDQATVLLTVPAAALQRVRDRWCVFVPKDGSTFEIRPVGRGRDLGGEVEIVSGLRAEEPIVVEGAFLLKAETERAADGEHEEH